MKQNTIVTYGPIKRRLEEQLAEQRGGLEGADAGAEIDPQTWVHLQQALQSIESADHGNGIMGTPRDQLASLLQSRLAEDADARNSVDALSAGGFEAKFDTHDLLGWVGSFFTWAGKLHPHEWISPTATTFKIDDKARIGLLSDWGTGLYGAPVCAESIAHDAKGFDILIHLGDVYYSGTSREVQTRFLGAWPYVARHAHFALNGNHEMYSGGYGYFDDLIPGLAAKSPTFQQQTSCFALENSNFLLVGLDTAYVDHDLSEEQVAWLQTLIQNAGGRKVVLMSHHQPFSLLDNQGPSLVESLRGLLVENRVFAWYWGHEHRLAIYDLHSQWGLAGRCIGHGGMPYFRDRLAQRPAGSPRLYRLNGRNAAGIEIPAGAVLDGPNPYIKGHEDEYGPNGYVVLEFDGTQLIESHRLPDGTVVYEQELA